MYNAGLGSRVAAAVVHRATERAAQRIVEIGCGTGHLLKRLGEALPGAEIIGVDLSPFMLDRARRHIGDLDNVRILHGDATGLQPSDLESDVVVAVHVLGHVPKHVAGNLLRSAAAALRQDGRVLTVEHSWHRPTSLVSELRVCGRSKLLGGMLTMREYARIPEQ
jgi:ubiquinone/menaquinone biosynthesis C-methylase UbiE